MSDKHRFLQNIQEKRNKMQIRKSFINPCGKIDKKSTWFAFGKQIKDVAKPNARSEASRQNLFFYILPTHFIETG